MKIYIEDDHGNSVEMTRQAGQATPVIHMNIADVQEFTPVVLSVNLIVQESGGKGGHYRLNMEKRDDGYTPHFDWGSTGMAAPTSTATSGAGHPTNLEGMERDGFKAKG